MKMTGIEKGAVLIVDDQAEDMQVLIAALQADGLTILMAQQGEHALALADRFTPDVILIDVAIPDMEGFETCRRLKTSAAAHAIPILFMLAAAETAAQAKGFEVGGADYLTKPLQREAVFARVTAYLTIRQLRQQLRQHLSLGETQPQPQNFHEAIAAYERALIGNMLAQERGNLSKTAVSLGMPLRTLYRKIKKYQML